MDEPQFRMTGNDESAAPAPLGEEHEQEQSVEERFLEHFGLCEQPFSVTPDPRFLYFGPSHKQALAALNYGTDLNRGFLTLIAQPGMGKTSLLFNYLEGQRDKSRTVFLFHTAGDSRELMSYILADLGIGAADKSLPEMHFLLNQILTEEMRAGRRFILVLDESQNLTEKVLESVRLLSNFETPWMKLMQIVLAGQPQLADRLAEPSMAQLRQRVSLSIRIEPLTSDEVTAYVDHRLWIAGYEGSPLFSVGARALLAEYSHGIPRNINNICFCAMSLAWATQQKIVDRDMMCDVLTEMGLGTPKPKAELPTAPKPVDTPKPSVVQNHRPVVFTIKEPPSRAWLPKAALASALLLALGWSAVHADVGKRVLDLWRGGSSPDKPSEIVSPSPASLDTASPAGTNNLSPTTESVPPEEKNPDEPAQINAPSALSGREKN